MIFSDFAGHFGVIILVAILNFLKMLSYFSRDVNMKRSFNEYSIAKSQSKKRNQTKPLLIN